MGTAAERAKQLALTSMDSGRDWPASALGFRRNPISR